MSLSKEELIYMSRIAESTERFEDMLEYMKKVVGYKTELNIEERNLLSVAYKNSVGSRRYQIDNLELLGELFNQLKQKKIQKAAKISNY